MEFDGELFHLKWFQFQFYSFQINLREDVLTELKETHKQMPGDSPFKTWALILDDFFSWVFGEKLRFWAHHLTFFQEKELLHYTSIIDWKRLLTIISLFSSKSSNLILPH